MASVATPRAQTTASQWRPITRLAFRFAFCYFGLYCLIAFQNVFEFLPYEQISHWFVPWVGQHVLHLSTPIAYFISGSGDKTSDWVLLFCHLVISIVATVVWTIFGRRKEYTRLNEWLRVALRYALALTMFAYGSAKVVKLQFADPSLGRLIEPEQIAERAQSLRTGGVQLSSRISRRSAIACGDQRSAMISRPRSDKACHSSSSW